MKADAALPGPPWMRDAQKADGHGVTVAALPLPLAAPREARRPRAARAQFVMAETSSGAVPAAAVTHSLWGVALTVKLQSLSDEQLFKSDWQVPVDMPLGTTQTESLKLPPLGPRLPEKVLQSWSEVQGSVHLPFMHTAVTSPRLVMHWVFDVQAPTGLHRRLAVSHV